MATFFEQHEDFLSESQDLEGTSFDSTDLVESTALFFVFYLLFPFLLINALSEELTTSETT